MLRKDVWDIDFHDLPREWPSAEDEIALELGQQTFRGRAAVFVRSPPFDMIMGSIIVINIGSMLVQLQWRSYYSAYKLGFRGDDGGYMASEIVFERFEIVYAIIYLVEMLTRTFLLRGEHCKNLMNLFDMFIVISTCIDVFVLKPMGQESAADFSFARLLRLLRVVRVLKFIRTANSFLELRVLLRTLTSSVNSLL